MKSIKMLLISSIIQIYFKKGDIFLIVKYLVQLINNIGEIDDIDHFGNRRIKNIGELIQNQVRIGLSRLERVVKERMTTQDNETITPKTLVNIRPLVASLMNFEAASYHNLDQTNSLAEITSLQEKTQHFGPGGLSRERVRFEVRRSFIPLYGTVL